MKEIKFRVWKPEVKSMMDLEDQYVSEALHYSKKGTHTLIEYTGIMDYEGTEIYDGDIIKYVDKGGITDDFTEPVAWDDEYGYYCTESSQHVWAEVARKSIVIGNIYQNKELLK